MEWHELLTDALERLPEYLGSVVDGLGRDDMDWRPRHDCNSIGWLVWHLTRQQDAQIASLMGEEQLWIKDEWYARFDRQPEPGDIGFGHTSEQVAAFRSPEAEVLLDYNRAVIDRSKAYMRSLSATDLDRELGEPRFNPLPTVGVRLMSVLYDAVIHAGQAAYVRGLLQGMGWQKY